MANYITTTPPGAWDFLGDLSVSVSTPTSIQSAVEALGVASGDLIKIQYSGRFHAVVDSGFPVATATTSGLSEWVGFWPNAPLEFSTSSPPSSLLLVVFRWRASA